MALAMSLRPEMRHSVVSSQACRSAISGAVFDPDGELPLWRLAANYIAGL